MAKPRPPRTASPVVREMMAIIDARKLHHQRLSVDAGLTRHTIAHWRHGKNAPTLFGFECVAQVLGYRVALVPLEPAE